MSDFLDRMSAILDRTFDNVGDQLSFIDKEMARETRTTPAHPPRYTVTKSRNGILIVVEVPGMAHEDVHLDLADGLLTISGKVVSSGHTVSVAERFLVGPLVSPENISASVKHGLLTVLIQRNKQKTQSFKVPVAGE